MYPTNHTYFTNQYTDDKQLNPDIYVGLYQCVEPVTDSLLVYLVGESLNKAIIDSGCTKTVCGKIWYQAFRDTLDISQQK